MGGAILQQQNTTSWLYKTVRFSHSPFLILLIFLCVLRTVAS